MLSMLGQGFGVTLQIFFLTLVGSLPLGVVVALARMSRVKPIAWIMKFYISVMRGTPLMLQMFFIYFAPYYIFGIPLSMESKFSATPIANASDVSFTNVMISLPIAGRILLITWGSTIFINVWRRE